MCTIVQLLGASLHEGSQGLSEFSIECKAWLTVFDLIQYGDPKNQQSQSLIAPLQYSITDTIPPNFVHRHS